jgi:hypothetical protein
MQGTGEVAPGWADRPTVGYSSQYLEESLAIRSRTVSRSVTSAKVHDLAFGLEGPCAPQTSVFVVKPAIAPAEVINYLRCISSSTYTCCDGTECTVTLALGTCGLLMLMSAWSHQSASVISDGSTLTSFSSSSCITLSRPQMSSASTCGVAQGYQEVQRAFGLRFVDLLKRGNVGVIIMVV